MKFTGYINNDFCTFTIDWAGHLIVTTMNGDEYQYNEESYDEDSYGTIRDMLIRDGVRDMCNVETRYTIKPEFLSLWGEDSTEDTVITEGELQRLAQEWGTPINELRQQLEEID